jgi:hypothetical protein
LEGIAVRIVRAIAAGMVLAATIGAGAAEAAPELSTTDQLKARRYVSAGDRAYVMGFQDGRFYAQGWHITGEMGGVWTQPLKLVDGVWFSLDGEWLPPATRFTSGWGYTRMEFPRTAGLRVSRTDFAPDGRRAALFGLHLENRGSAKTVQVAVDAHSEVMSHYPWAWTTPNAGDFNLPDTGAFSDGALEFHDTGTPHPNAGPHDWAALVGSNRTPAGDDVGPGHWGPQAPPVLCTAESQFWCDEGPFGKGTGGQLRYSLNIPAGATRTLWIAVAGSDQGAATARSELDAVLEDPAGALAAKVASRERKARYTRLWLPGDRRLDEGIDWGKQNILDLTQRADDLRIRDVDEGRAYPPALGTVPHARWVGAGYPDYPWIFATDAEYTAFASVSVGQFEAIEDHARALRDVSVILNRDCLGKVAHEIVGEGSVYFGACHHAGNTDETAKFPSLVALVWRWTGDDGFRDDLYPFAVRNLHYIVEQLDADGDGWPEGLGNVERSGMGEEKLDNTVYTIRGLYDLADMARAKGDDATATWASSHARDMLSRFEAAWWYTPALQYADSLDDPGDVQVFQKHWIGVTPMEAELTIDEQASPGIASLEHGTTALAGREDPCYSGKRPYNRGLFHTGCGGGPTGAGERTIFGLNTAIQAVGEGNYGRLGAGQQQRYTHAEVEPMFGEPYSGGDEVHHTPGTPDEQPGASPEIFPSPDFDGAGPRDANMERCTRCRSMVMQAWNQYGTMWPVVHQQLGVRPDLGRGRLTIVPQPPSAAPIAGRDIRLGDGRLDLVRASRAGRRYATDVEARHVPADRLWIGHTLPRDATVRSVELDGHRVDWGERLTNRGLEVTVAATRGDHEVVVKAG